MNNNDLEIVKKKLIRIIQCGFEINFPDTSETIWEYKLHGDSIGLNANDLLYLFFDIEKQFNIRIPQEDILTGRFMTMKGICEIIMEQQNISRESA